MAAGLGTRLHPFTQKIPKPGIPVLGVPSIQYCLDQLHVHGVKNVAVNLHHLPKEMERLLTEVDTHKMKLHISREEKLLLGSAGGIKKASLNFRDEPFFVINSDVLTNVNLSELERKHFEKNHKSNTVTLALTKGKRDFYREVLIDSEHFITGVGEKRKSSLFFTGVSLIEQGAVAKVPKNAPSEFLPKILNPAIERNVAKAFVSDPLWIDIGTLENLRNAHLEMMTLFEEGKLPRSWGERLEEKNESPKRGIWFERSCTKPQSLDEWVPPLYWSGTGKAPRSFGPNAVFYGNSPDSSVALKNGIGINSFIPFQIE